MKHVKTVLLIVLFLSSAIGYAQSDSYEITAQGTLGKYKIEMNVSIDDGNVYSGEYSYE